MLDRLDRSRLLAALIKHQPTMANKSINGADPASGFGVPLWLWEKGGWVQLLEKDKFDLASRASFVFSRPFLIVNQRLRNVLLRNYPILPQLHPLPPLVTHLTHASL